MHHGKHADLYFAGSSRLLRQCKCRRAHNNAETRIEQATASCYWLCRSHLHVVLQECVKVWVCDVCLCQARQLVLECLVCVQAIVRSKVTYQPTHGRVQHLDTCTRTRGHTEGFT